LGFAGQQSAERVTSIIAAAIAGTAASVNPLVVVPVAYADHANARTPSPEAVFEAAAAAGAGAFLIDTYSKDGRTLLDWVALDRLRPLAAKARSAGFLFSVAGSLDADALERVGGLADVVGVRGAVCRGGRKGSVDAALVRGLRDRLRSEPSAEALEGVGLMAEREAGPARNPITPPQTAMRKGARGLGQGA
jgi:uncharacterized protein (UPF0264 family)